MCFAALLDFSAADCVGEAELCCTKSDSEANTARSKVLVCIKIVLLAGELKTQRYCFASSTKFNLSGVSKAKKGKVARTCSLRSRQFIKAVSLFIKVVRRVCSSNSPMRSNSLSKSCWFRSKSPFCFFNSLMFFSCSLKSGLLRLIIKVIKTDEAPHSKTIIILV
jgi:hypothetical protein